MKVGEKERERRLWAALDCARLYSAELYCASLYWTTLCCTALYYTVYSAVTPGCSPGFRVRPPQRLLQQGPDKALDEEVCVLVITRSSAGENRAGRYSAVQCSAVQSSAVQCSAEKNITLEDCCVVFSVTLTLSVTLSLPTLSISILPYHIHSYHIHSFSFLVPIPLRVCSSNKIRTIAASELKSSQVKSSNVSIPCIFSPFTSFLSVSFPFLFFSHLPFRKFPFLQCVCYLNLSWAL
jgi:hypothetical protein